jgi:hypothetical protein
MSGHLVTGVGPIPELAIIGYRGAGSCRRGKPLCGCRVTGRPEREAGCGSRATGSELTQYSPTFLQVDTALTISAKPVGVGAASPQWILGGEQSGLLTRIAAMESGSLCVRRKSWRRSSNLKESHAMTMIEIKPHRNGWKVFEAPGVEPVFPEKQDAVSPAESLKRSTGGQCARVAGHSQKIETPRKFLRKVLTFFCVSD